MNEHEKSTAFDLGNLLEKYGRPKLTTTHGDLSRLEVTIEFYCDSERQQFIEEVVRGVNQERKMQEEQKALGRRRCGHCGAMVDRVVKVDHDLG